jgi:hypothetical protein
MLGGNIMRALIRSIALSVALTMTHATSAQTAENQEVLAAVHTLVNAWREPSVAKADGILHEDYRAESWQLSDTGRFVFLETRDHLLAQIATLRPGQWDVAPSHCSGELGYQVDPPPPELHLCGRSFAAETNSNTRPETRRRLP